MRREGGVVGGPVTHVGRTHVGTVAAAMHYFLTPTIISHDPTRPVGFRAERVPGISAPRPQGSPSGPCMLLALQYPT